VRRDSRIPSRTAASAGARDGRVIASAAVRLFMTSARRRDDPRRLVARRLAFLALLSLVLGSATAPVTTVELVPEDRASWRPRNLFAWLRPGHNFDERTVLVETSPQDAMLDLFYVRSNFQKRYEQAEAPARVLLPPRVEAGPRDALVVRAFREGYRQKEVSIRVQSNEDHLVLELEPLPNTLLAASHVYFAGRGSLAFLAKESLTVRVQDSDDGFSVVLAETALAKDLEGSFSGMESPLVRGVEPLQLGEDLLVQVKMPPGQRAAYELRSRQMRDELRDLYVYSVELIPADGGVDAVRRAREALARIGAADVGGCAREFDAALREQLDAEALARALAPRGSFTDPYLRAAMKRLAEVSPDGRIAMLDGTSFTESPIELAAALSQAAQAKGYLALLRAFVRELEVPGNRLDTLRGLVAPESEGPAFSEALAAAELRETRCRAGSADA
jgi:hypothetical protein